MKLTAKLLKEMIENELKKFNEGIPLDPEEREKEMRDLEKFKQDLSSDEESMIMSLVDTIDEFYDNDGTMYDPEEYGVDGLVDLKKFTPNLDKYSDKKIMKLWNNAWQKWLDS